MRDIGGPVISSITSSLMDVQPSDPLEYLIGLLTAQKDKREAGSVRDEIDILHFNDVYNIEGQDREPKGGAARFVTKVRLSKAGGRPTFANNLALLAIAGGQLEVKFLRQPRLVLRRRLQPLPDVYRNEG